MHARTHARMHARMHAEGLIMAMLLDIRIGTMTGIASAVKRIPRLLEHGFESFQLTAGWGVGEVEFERIAGSVREMIEGKALVSALGFYGNPILKEDDARLFALYIEKASLFGAKIVTGFAGALDGKSIEDNKPAFSKVWKPIAARAADLGVKIAFENCEMGGQWNDARMNVAHAPAFWEWMWNEIPGDNVGLCWEPCHQMVSLIDPIPQLRKVVGKVFNVHGKDATIAWDILKSRGLRGGEPYVWHRHPGFGDTNWTDIVSILRKAGYVGSIDIEGYHDPVYRNELEMVGQTRALRYLQDCRGGTTEVPNF
jgi:sugar phosphate isomerase/epimerase